MAATLVTGGSIRVEMDTGFGDGFTLNDTQQGVLDNTTYVLDWVDQFAEITDLVQTVQIVRGKKEVLDAIQPGRMTVIATDPDREMDPLNEASIYYDETDDTPGLSPLRQIRVSLDYGAGFEFVYKGRVVNFTYDYGGPGDKARVVITCADDLFLLANTQLSAFTPSAQLSSARLSTVLDRSEVSYPAGTRAISTGTTTLGAYAVTEGTSVLEYLRQIDAAERGRIFVSADGDLTFQPRIGNTLSGPTVEFADDNAAGTTKFETAFLAFSTDAVVNRATVQRTGGTAQTDSDATSIALYQIQAVSITNSLLSTDAQALTLAGYLLAPDPEPRFSGVEVSFGALTAAQKQDLATLEIGDTVSVERNFTSGSPATVLQEQQVEGLEDRIDFRTGHRRTVYTSPTTLVYALTLNDATFGTLDGSNVLT